MSCRYFASSRSDISGFARATYLVLLKGTYEERIFHAVNQLDEWFHLLIGSKKKEMGQPDDESALQIDDGEENVVIEEEAGRLTREEKAAVMIDLRPLSVPQGVDLDFPTQTVRLQVLPKTRVRRRDDETVAGTQLEPHG